MGKEKSDKILQGLNKEQARAVTHGKGPLLIIAGAGTGKTTVITRRIAWLIKQKKARPEEILAMTFTDKAAQEMEERVDKLLPYGYVDLWISTFHSFCQRILEAHALDIGLPLHFKVLDGVGQAFLVLDNFDTFDLDYYKPLGNPNKFIRELIKHFSRTKDELITPGEYLEYAQNLKLDKDSLMSDELVNVESSRIDEIARAYHTYQQLLLENNALDFGDLINYTIELFKKRPHILEKYRQQFKYVLVDEFQDTNVAQYKLLQLLTSPRNNITVVSDDDQCLPGDTLIDVRGGKKRIKNIKVGDQVVTAVGKGHISYSAVKRVFCRRKKARLLTFITAKGYKVQVTDNHKMFCFTPRVVKEKGYYYVYLMKRDDVGWRLGTTSDLAVRLKLERSADKVLAIRACHSEEEAKFFEMLYSLRYGIPTTCFKERRGVVVKGAIMIKLYKELDVDGGVRRLSRDLTIDLNAHHYCLDAVVRGERKRVKINFDICKRRYKSKYAKNGFLINPLVRHTVSVETSDMKIIARLRKAGFHLIKAKKGYRFKTESKDITRIGTIAEELQRITGGILECGFAVGKTNVAHQKALVMPAMNVLPGLYVPIVSDSGVLYDQVKDVKEEIKTLSVYDLEVELTHNFVANGVVVHNSIYKFRGASYNNVLQFRKDYPTSGRVALIKNYRSRQNILDLAYNFIQLNNPARLEAQEKNIVKKLTAQKKHKAEIKHSHFKTQEEEARAVVESIITLKNKHNDASWNDFAILIRANNQAEAFCRLLRLSSVPYQFLARSGLFRKPVILDILSYIKLLDNYHESQAVYRILTSPIFMGSITNEDLSTLVHVSDKKSWPLYKTIKAARSIGGLSKHAINALDALLSWIDKHTQIAKTQSAGKVIYAFIHDSGYLKLLSDKALEDNYQSAEDILYINQFFKHIENFENNNTDASCKNFSKMIDLMIQIGDSGHLYSDDREGPQSVKVSTVHSAKGLEWAYVFLPQIVDKRFPTISRKEPIEIPDPLIKEIIPSGDIHLQEERRLFYVALTRAKQGLFISSAEDYGGKINKKPSRFLYELNLITKDKKPDSEKTYDYLVTLATPLQKGQIGTLEKRPTQIPKKFSFSQFAAFEACPLQYKFAFILNVPRRGRYTFSFGQSIHTTLYRFLQNWIELTKVKQTDLFSVSASKTEIQSHRMPSIEDLLKIYKESWIDEWYENEEHQRKYKEKGKKLLKMFYKDFIELPLKIKYLEKGFNIAVKEYPIKGKIDRVDEIDDGLEIIDYKTGAGREKRMNPRDKEQLLIYQLAAQALPEASNKKISRLTCYYLENGRKISIEAKPEELRHIEKKIVSTIEKIKTSDFPANPTPMCKHCDFYDICEYRYEG